MKKSELTRRAIRATPKGFGIDAAELFQQGFEDGYRAARTDLRRAINKGRDAYGFLSSGNAVNRLLVWLRAIR